MTTPAGTCKALLTCSEAGPLPACPAASATLETCNGQDDNCDGQVDEGTAASCSDGDGCTTDFCNGGACKHVNSTACGDGTCAAACGESGATCPTDCSVCGDGACSPGESPKKCPADCCGGCGDGKCVGYDCGENPTTCPKDCGTPCGDGLCTKGESPGTCPADCDKQACGNQVCEVKDGGPQGCPSDCGTACGNCQCDKGEDFASCPGDCGYCGDATCSICASLGENQTTCPGDCGDLEQIGCMTAWKLFCQDASPCTDDLCQPGKGCVHPPATATCTDGNACTADDACNAAACQPGSAVVCNDQNPCTDDSCSPNAGCTVTANAAKCDDNNLCTLGDACQAGSCNAGSPVNCDDGNVCTDDTCKPQAGCSHVSNSGSCADGQVCTTEVCKAGTCTAKSVSCGANAVCAEPSGCGCVNGFSGDGQTCTCQKPGFVVVGEQCKQQYVSGAGTVLDAKSGLRWAVSAESTQNWGDAASYCKSLVLAGTGWTLPSIDQAKTIMPIKDWKAFPIAKGAHWTSYTDASCPDGAAEIFPDSGGTFMCAPKKWLLNVLCVRSS